MLLISLWFITYIGSNFLQNSAIIESKILFFFIYTVIWGIGALRTGLDLSRENPKEDSISFLLPTIFTILLPAGMSFILNWLTFSGTQFYETYMIVSAMFSFVSMVIKMNEKLKKE